MATGFKMALNECASGEWPFNQPLVASMREINLRTSGLIPIPLRIQNEYLD